MNRWLLIGSLAFLLVASTGCRMGCGGAACGPGGCSGGNCGQPYGQCGECSGCGDCGAPVGAFGKFKAHFGGHGCACGKCGKGVLHALFSGGCGNSAACGHCGCRTGCQAGPLGWQQGGLDYSSHLHPGLLGHKAPAAMNNLPFTPGPPSAQVGYPYYSHRGPRDFLIDNPPTIGR